MINKTVKSYATFTLLSLTLISVFSVITLPPANAVTSFDIGDTGQEKGTLNMAKGDQGNLCDVSDDICKQVNEDQSAAGSDNKVVGFNDQSSTNLNEDKTAAGEISTDVVMKIDGIDHSTIKVKVWITTKSGQEISKTFNPVPLLEPEDDNNGLISVPLKIGKGLLDIGDTYTGCIKVIQDTDKYGNKQSCQASVLKPASSSQEESNSLKPASSSQEESNSLKPAATDDGGSGADSSNSAGVAVMRISL
jgi:hypothetical protein